METFAKWLLPWFIGCLTGGMAGLIAGAALASGRGHDILVENERLRNELHKKEARE